ncbi:MAG: sulfatase, partial [Planctomycetes bacterium]|nr:sulfatase [Planctomycetota bacterium]
KSLRLYVKGPAYESADAPDNAYHDGAMTDLAIKALQQSRDAPFFMVVGFKKPHLPFVAPQKYWDLYDYERITLPDNYFQPAGAPGVAQMTWGELRSYAGIPDEGPVSDTVGRKLIQGYYASVSFVDAQVGRLMATLDEVGLTENTIVVLLGDHGWKLGEHAMWCKHTNYEIDAHVPFLIKAPGKEFQSGSTHALVELLDLYPTLCDLAKLPTPAQCEGSSLLSLLRDPSAEWNELAYTQYPRWGRVMGYSVKAPSGRYTEWLKRDSGKVVDREYYDHQLDPSENLNRADEADYASVIDSLSKAIAEERKRWEK